MTRLHQSTFFEIILDRFYEKQPRLHHSTFWKIILDRFFEKRPLFLNTRSSPNTVPLYSEGPLSSFANVPLTATAPSSPTDCY